MYSKVLLHNRVRHHQCSLSTLVPADTGRGGYDSVPLLYGRAGIQAKMQCVHVPCSICQLQHKLMLQRKRYLCELIERLVLRAGQLCSEDGGVLGVI